MKRNFLFLICFCVFVANVLEIRAANPKSIRFNQDLGYVNIMVNNALDITVYSDIVNTGIQQIVVIPISGIPSGDYTLVLESAFGYSDGGFGKE